MGHEGGKFKYNRKGLNSGISCSNGGERLSAKQTAVKTGMTPPSVFRVTNESLGRNVSLAMERVLSRAVLTEDWSGVCFPLYIVSS